MGTFILVCLVLVFGFGAALLLSTVCMGSSMFITLQVLMGSLRYDKEIDDKLNIVLGKVDAGLYHAVVTEHTIAFYDSNRFPDKDNIPNYPYGADISVWIENKFYSYGNIHHASGKSYSEYRELRPSLKVIKQIYALEKSKGETITKKKKKEKPSDTDKIVLE